MVETARTVHSGTTKVTPASLTLNPSKVNREITAGGLHVGMVWDFISFPIFILVSYFYSCICLFSCFCFQTLYGFVSSCEDHGYLIDIGVSSIKVFLPKREADQHFNKSEIQREVLSLF
jgi:hypothetical protein